jgi:hypothetical protein
VVPDLGLDGDHGPGEWPRRQAEAASPLSGLHHAVLKAQEVETLGTTTETHDPGLVGMQPQPELIQEGLVS